MLAPHLEARRNCPVSRSEQRRSPTPICITHRLHRQFHWCTDTPMAIKRSAGMYIAHPRGIYRCLVFDLHFEIFLRFQDVKTKRSKRLSLCLFHKGTCKAKKQLGEMKAITRKCASTRKSSKLHTLLSPGLNLRWLNEKSVAGGRFTSLHSCNL